MDKLHQLFSTESNNSVFVEKARIKEFADFPRRRKLSELTYKISKLALGIANTCLKQLGDVQIQPRALLCDGLRNELKVCKIPLLAIFSHFHYYLSVEISNKKNFENLYFKKDSSLCKI